jgi:IclR family transcriptional regulator, acetate operon repressor
MIDRALALLTAYTPADTDLSLAELARRTGIPKPTVYRLVKQLEPWGMVEKSPAGVRLGLGLFELGARTPDQRTLLDAAGPILADLAEVTRETVHLAVLRDSEVVYVQKLPSTVGPPVPSRLGGRMPAYCTAVGKVLLALSPPEAVRAALAGSLVRQTPYTVVAPGLIERQLRVIREQGYAEEHEESTRGIACVAAPVVRADGQACAAVSITGWADRVDTRRLALVVRTAALGVSRRLGLPASNAGPGRPVARTTMP